MKEKRQKLIRDLVSEGLIGTQEELVDALATRGVRVTQATASRDVREMGLIKRRRGGRSVYALPEAAGSDNGFVRVMQEAILQMQPAGNLLVIRTVTGMAMAVAAAIDSLQLPELVGDIAGDDTIFCAARSAAEAGILQRKLQEMIEA